MMILIWVFIAGSLVLAGMSIGYLICVKTVVKEKEEELRTILKETAASVDEKPFAFCPLCDRPYRK